VILIVTHANDIGADLVIRHLITHGATFLRLDTDRLGTPERHFGFDNGTPTLRYGEAELRAAEVKAVWARRFASPVVLDLALPEYRKFVARELTDVMEAFLDAIDGPSMNSYDADRKAGNRLYQSVLAQSVGFVVPETLVTQDAEKARAFVRRFNCTIAKAVSFGLISEDLDQVVHTSRVGEEIDFAGLAGCPVLLQAEIEKRREWRVTTVGQTVFAARTRRDALIDQNDWRRSSDVGGMFEVGELPREVSDRLLTLCERNAISFGAHDLIETPKGEFYFLETNPAGQWGWLEVELGLPVGEAVAAWLMSACGRS
jgi:glutathione synthase/RimK-type ligase-like ATP-grasp enzyme